MTSKLSNEQGLLKELDMDRRRKDENMGLDMGRGMGSWGMGSTRSDTRCLDCLMMKSSYLALVGCRLCN